MRLALLNAEQPQFGGIVVKTLQELRTRIDAALPGIPHDAMLDVTGRIPPAVTDRLASLGDPIPDFVPPEWL